MPIAKKKFAEFMKFFRKKNLQAISFTTLKPFLNKVWNFIEKKNGKKQKTNMKPKEIEVNAE